MHREFTFDEACGYLAGMIDGEGWISPSRRGMTASVRIGNTDRTLVDAVIEAFSVIGVTTRTTYKKPRLEPRRKGFWTVHVYTKTNLERTLELVPFRSEPKRAKLESALSAYRRPPPLEATVLAALAAEGLSQPEIAARLGVGLKRVTLALHRFEIKTSSKQGQLRAAWRTRRERYGPTGFAYGRGD